MRIYDVWRFGSSRKSASRLGYLALTSPMTLKFRIPDFIRRRPTKKEQRPPLRAADVVVTSRPSKVKKKFHNPTKVVSQRTKTSVKAPASATKQPSVRDILLRTTRPTTPTTSVAEEKKEPKKRIEDTDEYVDALKLQLLKGARQLNGNPWIEPPNPFQVALSVNSQRSISGEHMIDAQEALHLVLRPAVFAWAPDIIFQDR